MTCTRTHTLIRSYKLQCSSGSFWFIRRIHRPPLPLSMARYQSSEIHRWHHWWCVEDPGRCRERWWRSRGRSSGRSARCDRSLLIARSTWLPAGKSVWEGGAVIIYCRCVIRSYHVKLIMFFSFLFTMRHNHTLKVIIRWVKWNSASRSSWIKTSDFPRRHRQTQVSSESSY